MGIFSQGRFLKKGFLKSGIKDFFAVYTRIFPAGTVIGL
jgi:hypothetical protein